MIVMDEDNCMVDIAKFFLEFMVDESCGKCPPCRIGTRRMYEILEKITEGKGTIQDVDNLELLATNIKMSSLCALGQTSPNPVLSTLKSFKDEYIAHVKDKRCPAGICANLTNYYIGENCIGCLVCQKACPADAISGEKKRRHSINTLKCVKCGVCLSKCPFNAIVVK
jgi:NADH-quinone oxidoreductase subunit F/NADP-reducing hydrogenase subunit HndC